MATPYYDGIAKKWHGISGAQGGAMKRFVLNDLVLSKIPGIAGAAILELGAGNGYFMPLVLRRFSGQVATRIIISDQSKVLLGIAQRKFKIRNAEYMVLDVRNAFPLPDAGIDLIVANMLFNEIPVPAMLRAFCECARVLARGGRMVSTVVHPKFVDSLGRRGQLKPGEGGILTMPGSKGLRLPVFPKAGEDYLEGFRRAGFQCSSEDVYPTREVLNAKPGLRQTGPIPLASLFVSEKNKSEFPIELAQHEFQEPSVHRR